MGNITGHLKVKKKDSYFRDIELFNKVGFKETVKELKRNLWNNIYQN